MFDKEVNFASLDDFVHEVTRMATLVGEGFQKPDDDWAPIIIAVTPYGQAFVDVIPMTDTESKYHVFDNMIPTVIRAKGIARVALVLSSWGVKTESDLEAMEISEKGLAIVPEHRRFEMLWVVGHEDGAMVTFSAKIVRFPDSAPILGAWERVEGENVLMDRWSKPIQDALHDVASL